MSLNRDVGGGKVFDTMFVWITNINLIKIVVFFYQPMF